MIGRLIDADKLETHEQLEGLGNGMYDYVEVVYKDDIDVAPTIKAIPVKWLKERYKIEGYYGTDEYFKKAYVVKEIIADWEAERREKVDNE